MNRRLALAAAPLILLTACSSGGSEAPKTPDEPKMAIDGTVTLNASIYSGDIVDLDYVRSDDNTSEYKKDDRCQGARGYNDLKEGAQVTIADESGKTLALGNLEGGKLDESNNCAFDFSVSDVPMAAKFYSVKVSHRSGPQYTESQLQNDVEMTIGD